MLSPNFDDALVTEQMYEFRLAELRRWKLTITEAITELAKIFLEVYATDAYDINRGMCENFAESIEELVPGAVAAWGDTLLGEDYVDDDFDRYGYHCVIVYEGRYYDSQHPQGVDDFRDISAFHSNPVIGY